MSQATTLATTSIEHPAMDYGFLRLEGIRHLERMAGGLWTDFNAHDPGITGADSQIVVSRNKKGRLLPRPCAGSYVQAGINIPF